MNRPSLAWSKLSQLLQQLGHHYRRHRCVDRRCRGTGARTGDHHDRSSDAGHRPRPPGPHDRGGTSAALEPAGRGREQDGCKHNYWHAIGCAGGARRPHAADDRHPLHGERQPFQEHSLRSREELHAHNQGRHGSPCACRAPLRSGAFHQGIHCVPQDTAGSSSTTVPPVWVSRTTWPWSFSSSRPRST